MSLLGADVLLYSTAIGSEPTDPTFDSRPLWRRTMQGHAGANMCVLDASNRIGTETVGPGISFCGGSFIADETGALLAEIDDDPGVALATVDLDAIRKARAFWGMFRDCRPGLHLAEGRGPHRRRERDATLAAPFAGASRGEGGQWRESRRNRVGQVGLWDGERKPVVAASYCADDLI